jgi:ATP-dependent RNA helicase DHX37/DHR1
VRRAEDHSAAIEAEDLDLGDSHVEHLASDIDDGQDMSDPEGLDSGDEDTIATALGIDAEETDGP